MESISSPIFLLSMTLSLYFDCTYRTSTNCSPYSFIRTNVNYLVIKSFLKICIRDQKSWIVTIVHINKVLHTQSLCALNCPTNIFTLYFLVLLMSIVTCGEIVCMVEQGLKQMNTEVNHLMSNLTGIPGHCHTYCNSTICIL